MITPDGSPATLTVKFEKSDGVDASVDVPVLQGVAGGSVKVSTSGDSTATVAFEGTQPLSFAFQCFQVGVVDGVLSITSVEAGNIAGLAPGAPPDAFQPVNLGAGGLLNVEPIQ